MSRSISPNRITYELNKSSNNISTSFHTSFLSQNDTISNLKLQVFEKGQSRQDYQNLLSRYHILKSDLEKITKMKKNNEILLNNQENEEKNFLISQLKNENDILFEKINAQIAKNKKLYYENNLLYKEIGMTCCQNEELKEQISEQEKLIGKLSYEKDEMEKNIYELSEQREQQEMNIINFSQEINKINNENTSKNNIIQNKQGENMDIYKQIEEGRNINKTLIEEIKIKEKNISENQNKLSIIHKKINLYENDINNFKNVINKNYDEINDININIVQEKNSIDKLINENNNINNLIYNKESEINNMKEENVLLNKDNIIINQTNNEIYEYIMKYKNYLSFLVCQNKNLVSEMQLILGRDDEIKNILKRTSDLKNALQENKNLIINSSNINLEQNSDLKIYEQCYKNNFDINNSPILNYKLNSKTFSEKIENKFKNKMNIFEEKENENFINKSLNFNNKDTEKIEFYYNTNLNSIEKEPNLEENTIGNEFMNKEEKE